MTRRLLLLLCAVPIYGLAAPFVLASLGQDEHTAVQARVAATSLRRSADYRPGLDFRLAFPAARVERVWYEPGSCPQDDPFAGHPNAQWRVELRYYSYFAVPGPVLQVRCGGWAW